MGNCCAKEGKPSDPPRSAPVKKEDGSEHDEPERRIVKVRKGKAKVRDNGEQGAVEKRRDSCSVSRRTSSGVWKQDRNEDIPYSPLSYEPLSPTLFGDAPITPRKELLLAARTGNIIRMNDLLEHGTSTEAYDNDGRTPVSHACIRGDSSMLRLLLRHNASFVKHSKDGWTPLHFTIMEKRLIVAEVLLKQGADVNSKSAHGFTPLSLAAMMGNKAMVNLLVRHGADATITDKYDLTPAERAAKQSQHEIATMLQGMSG
eukprot:TRINITY_DN1545_c0_g2_i1.p1 TRINITY_DN1545_c0_g2~~TRINITY_DN1545_c0_g2_i1.p1  ORF type:complete len:259 (+),score=59.49 TRINITY_DN1545_c0_g2_i1:70-846(+)